MATIYQKLKKFILSNDLVIILISLYLLIVFLLFSYLLLCNKVMKASAELLSRLDIESVSVVVRRGRLRWFEHVEACE